MESLKQRDELMKLEEQQRLENVAKIPVSTADVEMTDLVTNQQEVTEN